MNSPPPEDRETALRAELHDDASALVEILLSRFVLAPDPLGDPLLLPRGDDDPVRLDDIDWAPVLAAFAEREGRRVRSGARQVARMLLARRAGRGGP